MIEVVSFAQAGAVVLACWAIISGIGAWKREFIGKRQIELAEQALAKFFEIKDAIAMIRSCRIPDDCLDPKRFPLFMGRAVMQELIIRLKTQVQVQVQTEKVN